MPITANIYYHLTQKGPSFHLPVVLIHGAGGTHLFWPPEIRRIPNYRIYAIDLPGHGKSQGHGLQEIQAYTERIITWMEALKLHRAVFTGHSMGGAIALTLAKEFRERVLGLILISTGARLRVQPNILENTETAQTYSTALSAILSKSFSKTTDPRLVSLARRRMEETRSSVLHGDLIACNNFDIIESLPEIKVPTLVIGGEDDEMTPLRYSQFLSDNITNASMVAIPNAGHMVMLEHPEIVTDAIKNFLPEISLRYDQD